MIALYIQGAVARAIERETASAKAQAEKSKFKKFLGCTLVVRDDEIYTAVMSSKEGESTVEVEYI